MNLAKDILKEKHLFKFRHIEKYSSDSNKLDLTKWNYIERIFNHNELYFPNPISLNDPLECRPLITVGDLSNSSYKEKYISYSLNSMINGGNISDPKEIKKWLENHTQEEAQEFCNQITNAMRLDLNRFRICSFSAVNNNPLLWSHYANSHQGFCLIFDADNHLFGSAMKVVYQDEYPVLDYTEENEYEIMKNSGLVKFTDWSYEEEFRLYSSEPNYNNALPVKNNIWTFPEEMLKGVIFGYNMSKSDRKLIEKLCENHKTNIYLKKAILNDDKFYLNIVDA